MLITAIKRQGCFNGIILLPPSSHHRIQNWQTRGNLHSSVTSLWLSDRMAGLIPNDSFVQLVFSRLYTFFRAWRTRTIVSKTYYSSFVSHSNAYVMPVMGAPGVDHVLKVDHPWNVFLIRSHLARVLRTSVPWSCFERLYERKACQISIWWGIIKTRLKIFSGLIITDNNICIVQTALDDHPWQMLVHTAPLDYFGIPKFTN